MRKLHLLITAVAVLGLASPLRGAVYQEDCAVAYVGCIAKAVESANTGPAEECVAAYGACIRRRIAAA